MSTKIKMGLLALTLILLAWFFINNRHKASNPAEQLIEVIEINRSPYFLPQYIALSMGFFKEQGLSVRLNTTSREAARKALTDRRADIILCSPADSILTLPPQKKHLPKAFAALTKLDGSFLLARKKTPGFQWTDLKEKTVIGDVPESSSQMILEGVLRSNNLDPYRQLIIYQNIPASLRLEAFFSGTGDYLLTSETGASEAEARGYGYVASSVGAAGGEMPVAVYTATADYIDNNQEVVQKFTNAIYQAQLWLKYHSATEAFNAVTPFFPKTDQQILLSSIERYMGLGIWPENPLITKESYDRFCAAMSKAGELASPVPYEETVITDFARLATENVNFGPHTSKKASH